MELMHGLDRRNAIEERSDDLQPSSDSRLDEAVARRLEETGRFRILRRMQHRPIVTDVPPPDGRNVRLGVVVDVETTGLDIACSEVIEIAAVAFTYDDTRIHAVVGTFEALQQPRGNLSRQTVRLTGLTDDDVRGRSIDLGSLAAFIRPADIVIAHNAGFDRPFCEKLEPTFAQKKWACSFADVNWKALGADSAKLSHLLAAAGLFHGAHRALADCHAVIEVLSAPAWSGRGGAFSQMISAANAETYEIRAERTPFDMRSVLKEQGYRWSPGTDGRPKCWLKVVDGSVLGSEVHFLRYEIYRDEAMPVVRKIEPLERFRR